VMRSGIWNHLRRHRGQLDPGLVTIWVLGLVVRFALAPLSFHSDLYQVYSRAHLAISTGAWWSWSSQLVAQLLHDAWLALTLPLLPGNASIWSPTAAVAGIGAQPEDIARFLAYPLLGRALVLMKLPYLLADAIAGWLIGRQVVPARRRWAVALWWLNPIVIYTSAVFGRHDSIWVVAVLIAIEFARRGARWTGLAVTSLAAAARFFPVFVVPLYLVAFRRSWRTVFLGAAGVGGLWMVVDLVLLQRTGQSPTLTLLGEYPHVRYLIALALPAGDDVAVPVLPLVYTIFVCWWASRGPRGVDAYRAGSAATLCATVALTPFHPQYVIWSLPLAVPFLVRDRTGPVLAAAQAALFLAWLPRWGAAATTGLLLPLGRDVIETLPDPQLLLAALLPGSVWQPFVRGAFAGVTLWIGWRALVAARRSLPGTTEDDREFARMEA